MENDDNKSSRRGEDPRMGFLLANDSFAKKHPGTVEKLAQHHFIYSIAGLALGLVCIIGGIVLFLNGIAGATSWTAKFIGAERKISDAAPGAVLFIVGLFIVFVTRFVVKIPKG